MGASGWDYLVAYRPDLGAALAELQDQVLASGDFLWDEEYYGAERPTTRDGLAVVKESGRFWDEGTHTVLDMDRVVSSGIGDGQDGVGAVRPLSAEEVREYFGTDRPTAADFERAYRQFDAIVDDIDRWTGRCTVLYDGRNEQQIAFFGCSGD